MSSPGDLICKPISSSKEPGGATWVVRCSEHMGNRRETGISDFCGLTVSPKSTGWKENPQFSGVWRRRPREGWLGHRLFPPNGLWLYQPWLVTKSISIKVNQDPSCLPVLTLLPCTTAEKALTRCSTLDLELPNIWNP